MPTVAKTFQSVFDNIAEHSDHIQKTIFAEESGFLRTLQKGEGHLEKLFVRLEANDRKVVSGVDVFFLYSSIGYPVDLIKEAAADKGFALDLAGFERAKADSRELSKAAQATESQSKAAPTKLSAEEVDFLQRAGVAPTETEAQYKRVDCFEGVLVAAKRRGAEGFLSDGQKVVFGEEAVLVLDRTCFYAESGGQIFDTGDIVSGRGDSAGYF